jgi:hypothetical protein
VRQNANGGERGCKIASPLSSKASARRGEGESRPRAVKREARARGRRRGARAARRGGGERGPRRRSAGIVDETPAASPSPTNSSMMASSLQLAGRGSRSMRAAGPRCRGSKMPRVLTGEMRGAGARRRRTRGRGAGARWRRRRCRPSLSSPRSCSRALPVKLVPNSRATALSPAVRRLGRERKVGALLPAREEGSACSRRR